MIWGLDFLIRLLLQDLLGVGVDAWKESTNQSTNPFPRYAEAADRREQGAQSNHDDQATRWSHQMVVRLLLLSSSSSSIITNTSE
jgi:hypothetical protein